MSGELKPCPFLKFSVLDNGETREDKNGEWYYYEDVDSEIADLRAEIDNLKHMYATQYGELAAVNKINCELKHQIANLQQQLYFKNLPAVGVEG